jgi:nuclear pore complex protein Nup98-Nup96
MMPVFKSRCQEELRLEDYVAGNKPGAAGAAVGGGGAFPAAGAFGQPATAGGFGAPAPAGGLGGFGQQSATPSAALFGSAVPPAGGLFAANAAPSAGGGLFSGSAATTAGLFGSTAAPAASAFGASAPSLFGAPQQPSLFGSTPGGGGFGQSQPAFGQSQPAFGQSQPSLFGQPQPQQAQSLFGAPPGQPQASAFGTPATQASLFGQSPATAASTPSLGLGGGGGGGLFGAPAATQTPTQPSLFGQPNPADGCVGVCVAAGGGGLFGAAGGFGAPAAALAAGGGLFGAASQPALAASTPGLGLGLGIGGGASGGGLFGSSAPALTAGGLGGFGGSGLFGGGGGAQQTGTGAFGTAGSAGLGFGASAFGLGASTASAPLSLGGGGSSLFPGGLTGGGLFGQQPQQPPQLQMMPQQQPAFLTASLDANPFGASNLFSGALSAVGAAGAAWGGALGQGLPTADALGGGSASLRARRVADSRAGPARAMSRLRTRTRTSALRRGGDVSLFQTSAPGPSRLASSVSELGTPSARLRFGDYSTSLQQRHTPRGMPNTGPASERPSRASTLKRLVILSRPSKGSEDDDDSAAGASRTFSNTSSPPIHASPFLHAAPAAAAAAPLAAKSPASTGRSRRELQFDPPIASSAAGAGAAKQETDVAADGRAGLPRPTPVRGSGAGLAARTELPPIGGPESYSALLRDELLAVRPGARSSFTPAAAAEGAADERENKSEDEGRDGGGRTADDHDDDNGDSNDDEEDDVAARAVTPGQHDVKVEDEDGEARLRGCPLSTRSEMFTRPAMGDLRRMSEEELSCVRDFAVGIDGIGMVEWPGETDVRHLNIDRDVSIKSREVVVYPHDEFRPDVGAALNKLARVSLHGLWKRDRATKQPARDASGAAAMVKKLKAHCDAEALVFLGYDVSTGTWTFETPHF